MLRHTAGLSRRHVDADGSYYANAHAFDTTLDADNGTQH